MVLGLQGRACQLSVDGGPLLILSTPDTPLAPNALAVDVGPHVVLEDAGWRRGQTVVLGASAPADRDADWRVTLAAASTWEPRPPVHRIQPPDLADRLRATRAMVVAEATRDSLLPLLWMAELDGTELRSGVAEAARVPARLLSDAAIRRDEAALVRATRGLAGLGPGLTPSGDDLLAGFAAAWTLVGEALGLVRAARERVTAALCAGARRGASPLGRAWLEHAGRGELLEPMTGFVGALLAGETRDPRVSVRGALAVGSSSGTDWMVGFLLGSAATLEATRRGRPW